MRKVSRIIPKLARTTPTVICAIMLITSAVVRAQSVTYSGMYFDVEWSPSPSGRQAFESAIFGECLQGYTCGLTNVEVDWDDGNFSSATTYLPFTSIQFNHTYGSAGLYHTNISGDDDRANWVLWQDVDITISS